MVRFLIVLPLFFAACSTEQNVQQYTKDCVIYGYEPGTPEMADCVSREAQSRRQAAAVIVAG